MRTILATATAVLFSVLVLPTSAQADSLSTIAYEGFDYPAGTALDPALNGGVQADGGSGWNGAWGFSQAGDSPLGVSATGLTYSGLSVVGGATQYRGNRAINGSGRELPRIESGVVYVRFLAQLSGGFNNGAPNMRLHDSSLPSNNNTLVIGSNNTGNNASLITNEGTPRVADSGVLINDNQIHLYLVRLDFSAQVVDLWMDPDLSTFDYLAPPTSDAQLTGYTAPFDRIDIFNRPSGAFDEITVMQVVSAEVQAAASDPERRTLSLQSVEGVSCTRNNVAGTQGTWIVLPASDECTVTTQSEAQVLGWATNPNFPVEIAQRQVDNGWGAYELFDDDGRMTAVFIPAGRSTFLSNSASLYPVVG